MSNDIVNDYVFLKDAIKILNLKTTITTFEQKCLDNDIKIEEIYHSKARKLIKAIDEKDLEKIKNIYKLCDKTLLTILKENHISHDIFYNAEKRLNIKKKFNQLSENELIAILEYCKLPRKDKIENGIIDNFGSVEEFQKHTLNKRANTNLERYGVENTFQAERFKEKSKQTLLKKYGVEHALQNEEILKNQKNTIKNKYGVENASQSEEIKTKKKDTFNNHIEDFKNKGYVFLSETGIHNYHSAKTIYHIIEKFNINIVYYMNFPFLRKEDYELVMNDIKNVDYSKVSIGEKEILDFVKSIYKDEIIENDRTIISPKELDIYIPNKKVAIEFDGLYYHSELFKDKYNLYTKTNLCEEKGIRLIHIFEDDWYEKREICKSIIASSLGIYKEKIFVRKCEIREVSIKEAKEFLIKNHLNGFAQNKYRYGLYYENELVMIACFGKSRRCDDVELIRICSKLNTQIIGGFSKLIHYFKNKNPQFNRLTSFINRNVFNGDGYLSSGFVIENYSKPSYWWVKQLKRFNRENFQKKKLSKILTNYDENLTEVENMHNNNYYRLFNCGTIKVVFDLSKLGLKLAK